MTEAEVIRVFVIIGIFWIPLAVWYTFTFGEFVRRLREKFPATWEDLGKIRFSSDARTHWKFWKFLRTSGYDQLDDPVTARLGRRLRYLLNVTHFAFVAAVIFFVIAQWLPIEQ